MKTKLYARIAVNSAGAFLAALSMSIPFRIIVFEYEASSAQTGASIMVGFVAFVALGIGNLAVSDMKD